MFRLVMEHVSSTLNGVYSPENAHHLPIQEYSNDLLLNYEILPPKLQLAKHIIVFLKLRKTLVLKYCGVEWLWFRNCSISILWILENAISKVPNRA